MLCVINSDGTNFRALTDVDNCNALSITWSPDGAKLAFVSHGTSSINIVNRDGSNGQVIINSNFSLGPLDWSPAPITSQ